MNRGKSRIALPIVLCMASSGAFAAEAETAGNNTFAGLSFGVGISVTVAGENRITSAQVVNGIVRVTQRGNSIARVMLESHYLFTPNVSFFGLLPPAQWGTGPFIGLQPGSDQIIQAAGIGWMIGFRRNLMPNDNSSFNIGVGVVVDPNAQVLGEGLVENQPLPTGETAIRYEQRAKAGLLLLASFSF